MSVMTQRKRSMDQCYDDQLSLLRSAISEIIESQLRGISVPGEHPSVPIGRSVSMCDDNEDGAYMIDDKGIMRVPPETCVRDGIVS